MKLAQVLLNLFLLLYSIWFVGRVFLLNRIVPLRDPDYEMGWFRVVMAVRRIVLKDASILLVIVVVCVLVNLLLLVRKRAI